jgi:hypothetical protein
MARRKGVGLVETFGGEIGVRLVRMGEVGLLALFWSKEPSRASVNGEIS